MRYDIEAIRERLSIEEIVQGAGGRLRGGRGPCPLCNTSHASTSFSVRNKRFRCFACGEHGDVIELIAKLNGKDWYETIPVAAKMADVAPGQRVVVKAPRDNMKAFVSESFRNIAALRDVTLEIANNPEYPAETRASALWATMEAEDTLDFILEEHPWR